MAADPRSLKHYKSHQFETNATWITDLCFNRSLLVGLYCVEIKKENTSSVISLSLSCLVLSCLVLSLVLQNVIAMHAGKVLYSSCAGKHGARYKTNFISLKAALTFQTLMLATLGKWATTHDRVIFLSKNCSWTSLPGST